ncbi:glycosyl hydrolase family 18 protein [Niallia taxi]|uniref:glycosyl hydrolase family 18 protein n=1 Tax=Niallia taxi TaxID=2499688 RepID=UPI003D2AAB7C
MAEITFQAPKRPNKYKVLLGLAFAVLLVVTSVFFIFYPFASSKTAEYFKGENPIILNGKQAGNAITVNGTVYLPLNFWQENIDESITYDSQSNSVIATTKDKVIQFPSESVSYFVNDETVDLQFPPIKDENGEVYVAVEPLIDFYPYQFTQLSDDTNAVLLEKDGTEKTAATFSSKQVRDDFARPRTEPTLFSAYTGEIEQKEAVTIEKEEGDYYFVRKNNGVAGYIKKDLVTTGDTITVKANVEEKKPALKKIDGPVNLTWEAVYSKNPDTADIPKMDGVNVVSPTWFKLSGNKGNVSNLGSAEYVKWAHKQGYQVWGLFSNDFDPEKTHDVFKNFETRQKVIRQLLVYSEMYHLDGINIDIENVNEEDGEYVTQFVREATPYFHEAGLTVSMDITFIADGNYSAFFERDHLSEIVDYLVVMAYDEHWATSPTAGSVASLPWVEENLKTLLKQVPNEKLVLGVPLYARLWEEKENGDISSESLSMEKVQEWLDKYKVKPTYDEESGQNYGEYYDAKSKSTYRIWLEDELSLSKRAKLVEEYDLAGIASWSRYFADESAWVAMNLEEDSEQ